MASDEVTIGELARRFEDHAAAVRSDLGEVKGDVRSVEDKVDKLTEVHAVLASHQVRLDGHDREIRDLKQANVAAEANRVTVAVSTETNKIGRLNARTAMVAAAAAVVSSIISAIGYHILR